MSDNTNGSDNGMWSASDAHVITLNGQDYAIGLEWYDANDAAEEGRASARDAKEGGRADLWCHIDAPSPNFALANSEEGHEAGMPVLATGLTSSIGSHFLAIVSLSGGYYVLACHEGVIVASTDVFLLKAEDAQELADQIIANAEVPFGDDELYAPAAFGFGVEADLSQLLTANAAKLKFISGINKQNIRRGAIAGLALALLGGGLMIYYAQPTAEELAAAQQKKDQDRLESLLKQLSSKPFYNRVTGDSLLQACSKKLDETFIELPGWQVDKVICVGAKTSTPQLQYEMRPIFGGKYHELKFVLEEVGITPNAFVGGINGPTIVGYSLKEDVVRYNGNETTVSKLKVREFLSFQFDAFNVPFSLKEGGASVDTFTSSHNGSLRGISPIIERLPIFTIETAEYHPQFDKWDITGSAYYENGK